MKFRTTRRMEFADSDMGGIVHFSRFFVFMETAEHAFLRSRGSAGWREGRDGTTGWPRVRAACEYLKPARYGETLDIEVEVTRKGTTSLTYGVTFLRGEEIVARGEMVTVHCAWGEERVPRPVPLPPGLADL